MKQVDRFRVWSMATRWLFRAAKGYRFAMVDEARDFLAKE